ncbi:hypothetical protein KBB27_00080 [Patescibacteria group bacterium]|nr:hypothetical protein [Patescibacteria group bacterium]
MLPQMLDFLPALAAFFLAQQNFNLLLDAGAIAGNWAAMTKGKLFLFWSHTIVEFARRTRVKQLVIEFATVLAAVAVFFMADGYCTDVRVPRYALLALLPSVGAMGYSLWLCLWDWEVVPAPYHLVEMKAEPDDDDVDMDDQIAVQARIDAIQAKLKTFGPADASPIPHFMGMIWSPLITAFSILALSMWMGWYGTFRLNGLERYWAMIEGLLACFALALSGLGYKIVVGAARAIVLRINKALAGPITAAIRTALTALPGITEENVKQIIPAYTGEFLEEMAKLIENTENLPIAKLQLLFAMNMVLPHPFTFLVGVVVGYVWKADYANQEAVGINTQSQMVDDAKNLSPWMRRFATAALVLVFILGASRSTMIGVLVYGAAIINPFLRLGLPEDTTVEWYGFILPFLGGMIIIAGIFYLSRVDFLPTILRRAFFSVAIVLAFVFVLNVKRGGAFQINPRTVEEMVACGLPPAKQPIFEDVNNAFAHQHATPPAVVAPTPQVIFRDHYYPSPGSGSRPRPSARRGARVRAPRETTVTSAPARDNAARRLVCCACQDPSQRTTMRAGGMCADGDCVRPPGAFCD